MATPVMMMAGPDATVVVSSICLILTPLRRSWTRRGSYLIIIFSPGTDFGESYNRRSYQRGKADIGKINKASE